MKPAFGEYHSIKLLTKGKIRMNPYILVRIECALFEGYSLFWQSGTYCAEDILVRVMNAVSPDKKQKITLEWDEKGEICFAFSPCARISARVYPAYETALLCKSLDEAFRKTPADGDGEAYSREIIFSLVYGPDNIKGVNEMLMKRWVFAN